MSNEITIILPAFHRSQRLVSQDTTRFRVLCCGRRWGKTRLGATECIAEGARGHRAWWVAPSYKVAAVGWREIRLLARQIPGVLINKADRAVLFPNGGYVQVRSADDPDSLRGEGLNFAVLDEAAYMQEAAWTEAIRPALADRKGRALIISTPNGRNWFWRMYQRGLSADDAEYASYHYATADNPFIDAAEIEAARGSLPEKTFRQEFLAEFLEDSGAVFRLIREAVTMPPLTPQPGRVYYAGVDWARSNDFTVIVVIDDQFQVVDIDRFNQVSWSYQRGRLETVCRKWGIKAIEAEANSIGEPNIEELVKGGLPVVPFWTTGATKGPLIEALGLAFEQGMIRIPPYETMIGELEAYEMERLPSGAWRYNAPSGMHDDTVIALALAWRAANSRPKGTISIQVGNYARDRIEDKRYGR